MGLFVDTVSANVSLPELGITLVHPTTNYDLGTKFDARMLREAYYLTTAITGGQLNWKKTSGGAVQPNADYDPDIALADEANLGSGFTGDRLVSFKDLTGANLTGASPGFSFGASGNITGAFLLNETVPSNKAGRPILLANAIIDRIAVSVETVSTFGVEVYEHDGTTFTLKYTLNVVSARYATATGLNISLTTGREMAVKISTGSAKNPVVTIIVKGDTA